MNTLLELVDLPNFHPATVHFPIALFPVALLFHLAGLCRPRHNWLDRTATALYILATIAAWVTLKTGEMADQSLTAISGEAQLLIGRHSELAYRSAYGLTFITIVRIATWHWEGMIKSKALLWLIWLGAAAILPMLLLTGKLGGQLVFRHGVAVDPVAATKTADQAGPSLLPTSQPREPLERLADGTIRFRPRPEDAAIWRTLLEPAPGFEERALRVSPAAAGSDGLIFGIDGSSMVFLPGSFGDLQIEAVVELLSFQGSLALVHHAQPADRGEFRLDSTGTARLLDVRDGQSRELAKGKETLPKGPFAMKAGTAAKHLRGEIDGQLIAHGHTLPLPAGRCGLSFEGRGQIRLIELMIKPLEAHD